MRRDFTIERYREFLEALLNKGFSFLKVCEYYANHEMLNNANKGMRKDANRFVLLRQDVDKLPQNSLALARIQKEIGIRSTFYFRAVKRSFVPEVIEEIAGLGHEIGYHYEDLSLAAKRLKAEGGRQKWGSNDKIQDTSNKIQVSSSDQEVQQLTDQRNNLEHGTWNTEQLFEAAIESFGRNLERLRKCDDVKTICMHGSPRSKWDSRLLWKYYDYREFGVDCEPYFDLNMESMLYLTDTGRRWNGSNVSVRDKAQSTELRAQIFEENSRLSDLETERRRDKNAESGTLNAEPFCNWKVKPIPGSLMNMTEKSAEFQERYNFISTSDIIRATEQCELPDRLMMTFHPQRWTDETVPWVKELVWQNTKNVAKYFLIKLRK